MSTRIHRCVRCGVEVYSRGAACGDCREADPDVAKSMAKAAKADLKRTAPYRRALGSLAR